MKLKTSLTVFLHNFPNFSFAIFGIFGHFRVSFTISAEVVRVHIMFGMTHYAATSCCALPPHAPSVIPFIQLHCSCLCVRSLSVHPGWMKRGHPLLSSPRLSRSPVSSTPSSSVRSVPYVTSQRQGQTIQRAWSCLYTQQEQRATL